MLVFRNSQQKPAGAWDQFLGHLLGKNPRLDGRSVAPLKRKTTVLLAEHEASVREFSALVLRSLGCRVLEAADGREALAMVRRYRRRQIDLMVTDLLMPVVGGKELADRLLKAVPDSRVLVSGTYPESMARRLFQLGDNVTFLQKPYTSQALAQKVQQLLAIPV